jgi:hypothetical protein
LKTVPVCGEVNEIFALPAEHGVALPTVPDTVGVGEITTFTVAVPAGHVEVAGIVYVTVYDPAALALGVITPVDESMERPVGVAEKVPPVVPVIVGV